MSIIHEQRCAAMRQFLDQYLDGMISFSEFTLQLANFQVQQERTESTESPPVEEEEYPKWFVKEMQPGIWCCFIQVHSQSGFHVSRYAYETEVEAGTVLSRLQAGYRQPVGVETDLAANYWHIFSLSGMRHFEFLKRTSQKKGWYVSKKMKWS